MLHDVGLQAGSIYKTVVTAVSALYRSYEDEVKQRLASTCHTVSIKREGESGEEQEGCEQEKEKGFVITKIIIWFSGMSHRWPLGNMHCLVIWLIQMLNSSVKAGRNHHPLTGCLVHSRCSKNVTKQVPNDSPDTHSNAQQLIAIHPK